MKCSKCGEETGSTINYCKKCHAERMSEWRKRKKEKKEGNTLEAWADIIMKERKEKSEDTSVPEKENGAVDEAAKMFVWAKEWRSFAVEAVRFIQKSVMGGLPKYLIEDEASGIAKKYDELEKRWVGVFPKDGT